MSTRPSLPTTAAAYGTSRAVTHNGTWNHVHVRISHAVTLLVLSLNGENMSLINIAPETPKRTIGQNPPAAVSQTEPIKHTYRAAPTPRTHGSSRNRTPVDSAFGSFDQWFILAL